ncbi:MAG TPA: VWA domain-containing protein [Vicinamibacterales bacterium]
MRRIALVLTLALTSAVLPAQERVEVRLVEVEVRVTDRAGNPVPDLTRADFQLKENDVVHDIATVHFVPPAEPMKVRWERPDGQLEEEQPLPGPVSPTWVYVATEAGPQDVTRVVEALREFFVSGLQPGYRVSLAGRPFTAERAELLSMLSSLSRGPLGTDGLPGLVDLARPLADDAAEERAMANNLRRHEEGTAPLMGFNFRPERIESGGSFAQPTLTVGRVDRQLPVYGDVALKKYFDIVEWMSELPGKKAIVLMRPGLRLELDNIGLMIELASYAVRRRVSFYTVDSRGLQPMIPVDEYSPIGYTFDRRPRRPDPDLTGQLEMTRMAKEGLESLARETGGRALIGTNRLADVFDKLAEDASGYYVLGYQPIDLSSEGRFRTIKVSVDRPGVKVQQTTRGYYEPRRLGVNPKDDLGLAMRRAVQREQLPTDLPVAASVGMFADADGFPVLVLSAGVPTMHLDPGDPRKPGLSATALLRISTADRSRLPYSFERKLEIPLDRAAWERARSNRTSFVATSEMITLLPGEYDWRIVFRDDKSGKLGGIGGRVLLRDFRGPSTPSSLLLTRQVERLEAPGDGRQPLDAGPLRFQPQPSPVFSRGETVHLLYSLYNATDADVASAREGMRLALFTGGRAVGDLQAAGVPVVDESGRRIDFAGAIRTEDLQPGTYTVVALLPNYEQRTPAQVEARFVIIDPQAAGTM